MGPVYAPISIRGWVPFACRFPLRHARLPEIRKAGVQGIEFRKFAGHAPSSMQEQVYVHLDNEDMKQSLLEKVYKIKDEEAPVKPYEERIELLEETLGVVLKHLEDLRGSAKQIVSLDQA